MFLRGPQPTSRIKAFFENVSVNAAPDRGRVLQYVGISSMYLSPLEILIYHLLRRNGFEVDYFVYDETIPINEVITRERELKQGKERFWRKSCKLGQAMLNAGKVAFQHIPVLGLAKQLAQTAPDLNSILKFEYEGIDFGNIVQGAMYRYYKSLTLGNDAESIARRMLVTALSNYFCVKDLCERNKYRYLMFSHGIYVTWQPVVEYCKKNDIDFICYDRAKTKDHGNFNVNLPAPDWSFNSAWNRFSDRELTSDERERVKEYLADRELQRGDVYAYNFSGRAESLTREKTRLGIPNDRKCITIFTNLIWDAANVSRDIAFATPMECVSQTIEHFRDRKDVQVIVRSHPAEKVLGTKERYSTLVRERFGTSLPSNVTLVCPEDDVNSFTMIDMTDVGVVNTSTVGLEMAVMGKPVVVISQTHYRNKGFTWNAVSPANYFETVDSLLYSGMISESKKKLAEKYFFMMMFLYQVPLPTIYNDGLFHGYICDKFEDLPDEDPIVRICQKLADDELELMEW